MPWFAVDDGFDTHPKVRKAGNAASGLFVRLGAHSAKHLTEGRLDGGVVDDYGTPATVKKLVAVGMLHSAGHDCPRCPQPAAGGFVIHDYLDYNKSRKQVESAREAGRRRQQKGRDKTRETRNSNGSDAKIDPKSRENGATLGEESRENEPHFEGSTSGQSGASQRYTLEGDAGVPSPPLPSLPSPEVKEVEELASYAREPQRQIPDDARPLVDGLTAAGVTVRWPFDGNDWFPILALISRSGVAAMVDHAVKAASRVDISSARYFVKGWSELPPLPPPGTERPHLQAVSGGWQPWSNPTDQSVYLNGW